MSSFPCKSEYRSDGCPQLTDSDEDETGKVSTWSKSGSANATSTSSKTSSKMASKQDAISSVEAVKDLGCWFVNRSGENSTQMESIVKMETEAATLQTQVEDFILEKERIQTEIRQKKKQMIEAIMKIIELDDSIEGVEALIADKLHLFQKRLVELETKRKENFLNSGDAKVRELLDSEIDEVKEEFKRRSETDEADRNLLTQSAQTMAASIGNVVELYQRFIDESITDAMLLKSPKELEEMEENFSKNMKKLRRLISRVAKFCNDEGGNRFYLNVDMKRVYKAETHSSEYKLNIDGGREKINDGFPLDNDGNGEFYVDSVGRNIYTKYYFEDDYGRYYIDIHGSRFYKSDPEASEYALVNGNWKKIKVGTYPVDERGLRIRAEPADEEEDEEDMEAVGSSTTSKLKGKKCESDDFKYIKEAVGPAIRKGLAAVVIHQPVDPVSFFANFLLDYRYNQQMFEKREQNLSYFSDLQKKLKDGLNVSECN